MLRRLLARSKVLNAWRPSKVRFSLRDNGVYFCPLMKRRRFPDRRATRPFAPDRGLRRRLANDVELVEQDGGLRWVSVVVYGAR